MKQILSSRESIILNLKRKEWHFLEASDGEEALRLVETEQPDLVVCDIRMPRMDGLEFLAKARELRHDLQVIMITAYDDMQTTIP